jgi:hypothetical protein
MNDMDDLDRRLAEAEKNSAEARQKTELALLKMRLFRMGLSLKTSDYEAYKNLEARIKEHGG